MSDLAGRTVSACTLGCKVNQYDTQMMLDSLVRHGCRVAPFGEKSDIVIINTCTVTGTGDNKSLKAIRRCAREMPGAAIVAAGCLAQRQAEQLAAMEGVRVVVGTRQRGRLAELLAEAERTGRTVIAAEPLDGAPFEELPTDMREGHTRAVLKIQEGCENRCSYCIIPQVRGPVRSRSLSSIASEAERLAAEGYREIVITGVHLNSYGRDTGETLERAVLAALEHSGSARIRLGSLEPSLHYDRFCGALAGCGRLCPQFHLALQSGSDAVLGRMRRRYNTDVFRQSVRQLRAAFPDCAITTDVICGFPGETEADFDETLAFVREIGFMKTHAFPYSEREGTDAAAMTPRVPVAVRQQRAQRLIAQSEAQMDEFLRAMLGRPLEVIFEECRAGMAEGYSGQYCRCRAQGVPLGQLTGFIAERVEAGALVGRITHNEGR